jgi:poly(3-hydroxybutyrate) depolymerase
MVMRTGFFGSLTVLALLCGPVVSRGQSEEQWTKLMQSRAVHPSANGYYEGAKTGPALYFLQGGNEAMPYIVRVPRGYDSSKAYPVVVFLHGAILAVGEYQYGKKEIADEPIFNADPDMKALVVFPFAKSDYKWSGKSGAYEDVARIVGEVKQYYHTDEKRVYIGGISMGGIATFWFVNHHPELFAGFYTFSANPAYLSEPVKWSNITTARPMYSVHAKDDQGFPYADVQQLYEQHRTDAPGWHFSTVDRGGHRFIYTDAGLVQVKKVLEQLLGAGR